MESTSSCTQQEVKQISGEAFVLITEGGKQAHFVGILAPPTVLNPGGMNQSVVRDMRTFQVILVTF